MRFGKVGNILYLILGILFAGAGLIWILAALVAQDAGNAFYGVVLLLIGGARIFWSIARMRALSQYQARQLQAQQMGMYGGYPPQQPGYPYQPQPGYPYPPQQPGYPPQQPMYPQQPGYPPQPGQYGGQYGGQFPPQQRGIKKDVDRRMMNQRQREIGVGITGEQHRRQIRRE
ncbi:MAG: hypothetical protein KGO05_15345 [Chloroflexota bacterium]|nr:hypothetical protein [Chloroflexota bacterium]